MESNTWRYWKKNNQLPDDVSHASLTVAFPYECWKYKISANGKLIYKDSDMQAYSNTFTKDLSTTPLFMHVGVGDHSEYWNFKSDIKSGQAHYDNYICYRWLCLSEYTKEIYQQIADIHAAKNYYDKIKIDNLSFYSSLTLALLVNHENLIVPTNTNHEWGESSDWRGVASGNFYDNKDEFVFIRNYNGMIGIMEPDGRDFKSVINSKIYGNSYDWKGITAGDFFGDGKSEIIALSNHFESNDNGFYILTVENNAIIEQSKLTGFGGDSDWARIASGNFISAGKDDFVAVRNYNKEVLLYQFNGTTPQLAHGNALNLPADFKIKAVASGNLDGDPKDEIVLLVDSSDDTKNGIHVYDIDDNGILTEIAKSTGGARLHIGKDWR